MLEIDDRGRAWSALRALGYAPEFLSAGQRREMLQALAQGNLRMANRWNWGETCAWYPEIVEIYARKDAQKEDGHGRH